MKFKHIIIIVGALLLLCIISVAVVFFVPNGKNESLLLIIPKDATYSQVIDSIENHKLIKCELTFRIAAKVLRYDHIKQGKYVIGNQENNFQIIKKLRKGQHYPVKFTINNIRTQSQLLNKIASFDFLFSIDDLHHLLNDTAYLRKFHLTPETSIVVFMPNTYEFYHDISADDFFQKMVGYYEKFWSNQRLQQAESIGFTPIEVITLASIVEEENFRENEKAVIAGLYINRLHRDMLLQADPTVKYALNDFSIKRVYEVHTLIDSPYNTYKYKGLPPGPIRIPALSTIDSVLNYTHHNYIYMCAKEDFSGSHNFTANYNEHINNATRYRKALSQIK